MNTTNIACTKAQPQVHDQLDLTRANAERLEKTIYELEERLAPILRQQMPVPENGCDRTPEPVLVPIADSLRSTSRGLDNCISRLRSIIERTEV